MGNRYSSKVAQADWILVRKEGLDDRVEKSEAQWKILGLCFVLAHGRIEGRGGEVGS